MRQAGISAITTGRHRMPIRDAADDGRDDVFAVPSQPKRQCAVLECKTLLRATNPGSLCSVHDTPAGEQKLRGQRLAAERALAHYARRAAMLPSAIAAEDLEEAAADHDLRIEDELRELLGDGVVAEYRQDVSFGVKDLRAMLNEGNKRRHSLTKPLRLCKRGCGRLAHLGCCRGVNHRGGRRDVRDVIREG